MNGVHDMGATDGHGPVIVETNEPVFHARWEGRVYGMMRRLRAAGLFNLDEFRYAQERLPPGRYLASSYYERWLAALETLVEETGAAISSEALPERRAETRFQPGDRVVTRNLNPRGHTRLPRYGRGRHGTIESIHGPFTLPDTSAHRAGRDVEPVYTVRFAARELWGERAEPNETMTIDLWQRYLEADAT
ncbi:MAG TPA: nitrile hydratase subunit beta [Candidatus Limnocylindrales bacterium]|nr:nitrile hydratase subunit beta [Candidatus Limnocylindrales bacterium]